MKLPRSDLALVALGIVGLAAFLSLYDRTFPQAAVDLEVTRDEAVRTARDFVVEQGAELEPHRRAVVFSGDSVGLTFLQRQLGVEEASRWAREEVPIWTWNLRWFQPEEKEEWVAEVGMAGDVVGYRHLIEEAAEGAELGQEAARRLAEDFLRGLGWELAELEEVEASTSEKDNRTDHSFVWERQGTTVDWRPDDPESGTGSVRMSVTVQGDRVGGYSHFLRVPEEFRRELSSTQSVGTFLALSSLGVTVLLTIAALIIAIIRYRRDDIRWRPAIALGLLVFALMALYMGTSWPTLAYNYPTDLPWAVFVGLTALSLLLVGGVYGAMVLFNAAAGESLGRETFPESLRGFAEAATGRLTVPEFAGASLRGYALGFAFIGYLTVFYLFAQRYLGAWLPAEGPYSEIFNLYLPFLAPLTISLVAAISEEVMYRLLGISLLKKLLGSWPGATAVALVVPAAVWAFAHSTYPVFPVWLRGIELTLGGVLFGLAFIHWGLLTCVVAHYVVDAFLLSAPLLTSGNTTYVISGAIAIGLALVPGLLGYLSSRGAAPDEPGAAGSADDPGAGDSRNEVQAGGSGA